jgi:hypothetical protein
MITSLRLATSLVGAADVDAQVRQDRQHRYGEGGEVAGGDPVRHGNKRSGGDGYPHGVDNLEVV